MLVICENLRGFCKSRPPVVLFMLCLGACAVVLLTLAYIVKVNDIQNPDERDWNMFMDGFKELQFCMMYDQHDNLTATTDEDVKLKDVVSKLHSQLEGGTSVLPTAKPSTSSNGDDLVSVSVTVWVDVEPTRDFVSIPHNVTHLTTTMEGRQIGLQGSNAATTMNVTLSLPFEWNSNLCTTDGCHTVKIQTCVNVHAPARLFPRSRKPTMCVLNVTHGAAEYRTTMVGMKRTANRSPQVTCASRPLLTVNHKQDLKLRIMLSLQDRSAINLHLMHTSYFLFVMVITMICYALIRGSPVAKSKPVQYTEVSTQA